MLRILRKLYGYYDEIMSKLYVFMSNKYVIIRT